ncbi:MAG: hypothetical protein AAGE43_11790 [Pseudomonadota bacterium]
MNPITKEFQYGDQTVVLETGRVAKQATGAVLVSMGPTVVLCTVVGAPNARPGQDFFPLTVNYQEKTYAWTGTTAPAPSRPWRRRGR